MARVAKKKIIKALSQAIEEVAEAFDVSAEDVVEVFLAAYGDGGSSSAKKAAKKATAKKASKKSAKKKAAEAPDLEPGQAVKVKVDGKWKKGEVKRVLKTKVRVKTKDGVVSAPFEDVKPIK